MRRKQFAALGAVAAVGIATGTTFALATSSNAATTALEQLVRRRAVPDAARQRARRTPAAIMDATGQKAFQLAFILAPNGGGCSPDLGRHDRGLLGHRGRQS